MSRRLSQPAWAVPCPKCGAAAGSPCVTVFARFASKTTPHRARVRQLTPVPLVHPWTAP